MIRDKNDNQAHWVRKIRFLPYMPENYLKPKFDYDETDEELRVTLKNDDPEVFPPDTATQPIPVEWSNHPKGLAISEGKPIESPSQAYELRAKIHATIPKNSLLIWLDVDGCPRAFQYKGPGTAGHADYELDSSLRDLRITSPADGRRTPRPKAPSRFRWASRSMRRTTPSTMPTTTGSSYTFSTRTASAT